MATMAEEIVVLNAILSLVLPPPSRLSLTHTSSTFLLHAFHHIPSLEILLLRSHHPILSPASIPSLNFRQIQANYKETESQVNTNPFQLGNPLPPPKTPLPAEEAGDPSPSTQKSLSNTRRRHCCLL